MSEIRDWEAGEPCERHYLAFCADCRALAGIVRAAYDGKLHYSGDCTVMTFAELTGADYDEAAEALRAAGYRPGRGAYTEELASALRAVGYEVRESSLKIEGAILASGYGPRTFFVTAAKGRKGHAWSIVDGRESRPYAPPYRYRLYEVTA